MKDCPLFPPAPPPLEILRDLRLGLLSNPPSKVQISTIYCVYVLNGRGLALFTLGTRCGGPSASILLYLTVSWKYSISTCSERAIKWQGKGFHIHNVEKKRHCQPPIQFAWRSKNKRVDTFFSPGKAGKAEKQNNKKD